MDKMLQKHLTDYRTYTIDKEIKFVAKGEYDNVLTSTLKYIATWNNLSVISDLNTITTKDLNLLQEYTKSFSNEYLINIRTAAYKANDTLIEANIHVHTNDLFLAFCHCISNSDMLKSKLKTYSKNALYSVLNNYLISIIKSNNVEFFNNLETGLFELFPAIYERGIQDDLKKINKQMFTFTLNKLMDNPDLTIEDIDYTQFKIEDDKRIVKLEKEVEDKKQTDRAILEDSFLFKMKQLNPFKQTA